MDINLDWILLTNYTLIAIIIFIVLFIFLRRLVIFPFNKLYVASKHIYRSQINRMLILPQEEIDANSIITRNITEKLALENVLIDMLEEAQPEQKPMLTKIFEATQLVNWRIRQLNSNNVWKRRSAADALGKSLSKKAVVPLVVALRDPDEDVRLIAARALGKVKAKSSIEYIISLLKDFPQEKCINVANILIDFKEAAVPYILNVLNSTSSKTRFWSVRVLAEIQIDEKEKFPEFDQKISNLLHDENEDVRAYAVIALAKNSHKVTVQTIIPLLNDDSPLVRTKAADALGIMKNKEAIEPLLNSLGDFSWNVNLASSEALLSFGNIIEGKLKEGLQNKKNIVRKRCRELLEEIK